MDSRLDTPWLALRYGIGLTAMFAGIDKFFNLLADWPAYVSPMAARFLPFSTGMFMELAGIVELAVGVSILTRWPRTGGYVAAAWLTAVAVNLVLAGFFDVAVRDLVMAVAAFTLARLAEVRVSAAAPVASSITSRVRMPA
jgi:hypothetical protein